MKVRAEIVTNKNMDIKARRREGQTAYYVICLPFSSSLASVSSPSFSHADLMSVPLSHFASLLCRSILLPLLLLYLLLFTLSPSLTPRPQGCHGD